MFRWKWPHMKFSIRAVLFATAVSGLLLATNSRSTPGTILWGYAGNGPGQAVPFPIQGFLYGWPFEYMTRFENGELAEFSWQRLLLNISTVLSCCLVAYLCIAWVTRSARGRCVDSAKLLTATKDPRESHGGRG